jgi:hypothetical protein
MRWCYGAKIIFVIGVVEFGSGETIGKKKLCVSSLIRNQ